MKLMCYCASVAFSLAQSVRKMMSKEYMYRGYIWQIAAPRYVFLYLEDRVICTAAQLVAILSTTFAYHSQDGRRNITNVSMCCAYHQRHETGVPVGP